jgi:hypothetical protein
MGHDSASHVESNERRLKSLDGDRAKANSRTVQKQRAKQHIRVLVELRWIISDPQSYSSELHHERKNLCHRLNYRSGNLNFQFTLSSQPHSDPVIDSLSDTNE